MGEVILSNMLKKNQYIIYITLYFTSVRLMTRGIQCRLQGVIVQENIEAWSYQKTFPYSLVYALTRVCVRIPKVHLYLDLFSDISIMIQHSRYLLRITTVMWAYFPTKCWT